mmetsp:Transcript_47355/g.87959  ORF Transcript_47355/g.87959 Transcript_47355/m.87959 type:complete len:231 (-) Transcript_47355:69-761(-)
MKLAMLPSLLTALVLIRLRSCGANGMEENENSSVLVFSDDGQIRDLQRGRKRGGPGGKWGGFHSNGACRAFEEEGACETSDDGCRWCLRSMGSGLGFCTTLPDDEDTRRNLRRGGGRYRGGGCCEAAADKDTCENNGDECVWLSGTIPGDTEDTTVGTCTRAGCKLYSVDDCTNMGCVWDPEYMKCNEFRCKMFDAASCASAGDGSTCEWVVSTFNSNWGRCKEIDDNDD